MPTTDFKLRPRRSDLAALIGRYSYPGNEKALISAREGIRRLGRLTKEDLRSLARWKSPRSAGRIESNRDSFVEEVTAFSLGTPDQRARIEALTILDGVGWPTASVILHFYHRDPYPILDFRTLWSLSAEVPRSYTFDLWWRYVGYCRRLSEESGLSMRDLDRGLWQFSKERQRPGA